MSLLKAFLCLAGFHMSTDWVVFIMIWHGTILNDKADI